MPGIATPVTEPKRRCIEDVKRAVELVGDVSQDTDPDDTPQEALRKMAAEGADLSELVQQFGGTALGSTS